MVKNITVFTRTTCAPCKMLKSYLTYKGVNFSEVNVDEDREGMDKAYRLSGVAMVPVTLIEKDDGTQEIISGYNLGSLSKLVEFSVAI